jgi:hypothetical protein
MMYRIFIRIISICNKGIFFVLNVSKVLISLFHKNKHMTETPKIEMPLASIFGTIKVGLEHLDLFSGGKTKHKVKQVSVMNADTIKCEFYAQASASMDIKMEIVSIMSFLNGLLKGNSFKNVNFSHYAVVAFSTDETELMHAICSAKAVSAIGEGNAIEWIKATTFQEYTNDYRLGIAKKMIADVEQALRHTIKSVFAQRYSEDWWDTVIAGKLSKEVKDTYFNQFGVTTNNGNILIDYTFVLQLKRIILANWPDFKDLFESPKSFENSLDLFNKVRREEAHNRAIKAEDIKTLEKIYVELLINIGPKYPDLFLAYLVENWSIKIRDVVKNNVFNSPFTDAEIDGEFNLCLRLEKSVANIKYSIQFFETMEEKLSSIVTPIQKKKIHCELIDVYKTYKQLHQELLTAYDNREFGRLSEINQRLAAYKITMREFSDKYILSES